MVNHQLSTSAAASTPLGPLRSDVDPDESPPPLDVGGVVAAPAHQTEAVPDAAAGAFDTDSGTPPEPHGA